MWVSMTNLDKEDSIKTSDMVINTDTSEMESSFMMLSGDILKK